jgi:osmotically inducible protein OsmC
LTCDAGAPRELERPRVPQVGKPLENGAPLAALDPKQPKHFRKEISMAIRKAQAVWEGNLEQGRGTISLGGDKVQMPYGFAARFEDGAGSNPEELIGGAHAGCFSMALAHELSEAGHPPAQIETTARVHLEKSGDGFAIPTIELETEAEVPGVDNETFQRFAQGAKENCPVSKALSATEITLSAKLLSAQESS